MKYLVLCLMFLSTMAFARGGGSFGGGRAGGFSGARSSSFSSSRSSSFGGARSSSTPATISRPSASRSTNSAPLYSGSAASASMVHVYNHDSGGNFFTNMMLYQMMFGNHQQPIMVAGQNGQAPVVVYQEAPHGFLYYVFWGLITVTVVAIILALLASVFA